MHYHLREAHYRGQQTDPPGRSLSRTGAISYSSLKESIQFSVWQTKDAQQIYVDCNMQLSVPSSVGYDQHGHDLESTSMGSRSNGIFVLPKTLQWLPSVFRNSKLLTSGGKTQFSNLIRFPSKPMSLHFVSYLSVFQLYRDGTGHLLFPAWTSCFPVLFRLPLAIQASASLKTFLIPKSN